ncbi:hypothetical protein Hanom_Chr07g00596561 [Helianthus anomalus]
MKILTSQFRFRSFLALLLPSSRNVTRFFRDFSRNLSQDNGCSWVYKGLMNSIACTNGNHLHKFDAIVEIKHKDPL